MIYLPFGNENLETLGDLKDLDADDIAYTKNYLKTLIEYRLQRGRHESFDGINKIFTVIPKLN